MAADDASLDCGANRGQAKHKRQPPRPTSLQRLIGSVLLRQPKHHITTTTRDKTLCCCSATFFPVGAMESHPKSLQARSVPLDSDGERPTYARLPPSSVGLGHRSSRRKHHAHPKPPLTPNTVMQPSLPQTIMNPVLPSAPASPPTPAPSPTPLQRVTTWRESGTSLEDPILRDAKTIFSGLNTAAKEVWLTSLVDACDINTLSFLHHLVSPKLKKDPFSVLPDELCLKVTTLICYCHYGAKYRTCPSGPCVCR